LNSYNIIWKLVNSSILIAVIGVFYRLGIWSFIVASKFIEENDNKKKLIDEAWDKVLAFKAGTFEAIINTLPFICIYITLYLALRKLDDNGLLPILVSDRSLFIYLYMPILFVLFQISFLLFCFNKNRQEFSDNGSINYNFPIGYYVVIALITFGIVFLESNLSIINKNTLLDILQISDAKSNNLSVVYGFSVILLHFLIIKPLSKYIVFIEEWRYLRRLIDGYKNDTFSFAGICGFIVAIACIMFSSYFLLDNITSKIIIFPIGNIILIVCITLVGAVLSGQRTRFLKIRKSYELYRKKLYYVNSDGKRIKREFEK